MSVTWRNIPSTGCSGGLGSRWGGAAKESVESVYVIARQGDEKASSNELLSLSISHAVDVA
jgi:hypothetical protein